MTVKRKGRLRSTGERAPAQKCDRRGFKKSLDHATLTDRIREDCLEKEVANVLTLSRFPMLLIFILMVYFGNSTIQIGSVIFLFLALMIDTIDGPIARRTGKANLTIRST
jgi:hypothetical protein